MLSSWFEFFLDYRAKTLQKHPNTSENEMNNSLAAKLHQVERARSEHAARNKMEALAFDSIHCCLPRLYRCLETLD